VTHTESTTPPATRPAASAATPVVYISGSGRSGSTMLERVLHSAPGVTALGEFHCLWRLDPGAIACSCGGAFPSDPFWVEVLARAGVGDAELAELRSLELAVCRSGYLARHGFSLARLAAQPPVQRFVTLQRALFDAVAATSGASVLVDSSKAGPRAWLLALDPAVHFVHLHRDPADVLVSWRSIKFDPGLGTAMKRMPVHAAALDWWKVDRLAALLARQRKVVRVDYRTLCAAPRKTVGGIWNDLGIVPQGEPQWLSPDTVQPGADYHSLNGNPDRFDSSPFRISQRRADWTRIAPRERPLIRATAGALRLMGGA
jgi:hypothetical protein